jgi:hypothetical protein
MRIIRMVNVVPSDHSNETNDDSEPSVAVNPNNPDQLVVSAFTPPDAGNTDGPIFFSDDGGENWSLRFDLAGGETHDQSPLFARSSNDLYMGTLRGDNGDLNVLRSDNPAVGPFPRIERRDFVDQPWVEATTVVGGSDSGKDRIYVGYNDTAHGSQSATVDVCLDAAAGSSPSFTQVRLDPRSPSPSDGYEIRPTAHSNGTVYIAYKSWHLFDSVGVTTDIVVARDDSWGSHGFTALTDPDDHKAGRRVATNVRINDPGDLGGIRLNNDLNIAVDPTNSDVVYVVWCDNAGPSYTLRVQRSINGGVDWSGDLLSVDSAALACLAINARGTVGLLYQQLVGGRMETHFRTTNDGATWDDVVLSRTDTSSHFTGDYARLIPSGIDFYGVFPAMNSPDPANFFPNGGGTVRFQRNTTGTQLRGSDGTTVIANSVDPFFFKVQERACAVITDRSTFGRDEVDALLHTSAPAVVTAALYVVVDGFRAQDLGITATTFAASPNVAPAITFYPALTGMTVRATACVAAQDQANLTVQQRFTWVYDVLFNNSNDFSQELRQVDVIASITGGAGGITVTGQAELTLTTQPNPYEVDGAVSWLSTDLRVFKLRQGQALPSTSDVMLTSAGPNAFITSLIQRYNDPTLPRFPNHPFDGDLSTDEQASQLTIAGFEGFPPQVVHNFAVARVRYRALATSAPNARVFFRLFQAATTSVEFQPATTFRTGGQGGTKIPLLGVVNGEAVTIPCFAAARINPATQNMNEQTDPTNVGPLGQPIPPDGTGAEVQVYFGCWLDINQSAPVVPINPSPIDGPFTGGLRSVQQAIVRSPHQCLVAEINLDPPEPQIVAGQAPSTSDKLAQRNLSIIGVSSPHLVPQPFDLKPTAAIPPDDVPDELMIDWRGLPSGSQASVYFPSVPADEILGLASRLYGHHGLARSDEHTLTCRADGISFVPIPSGLDSNLTGLMSVELPPTVREGEGFQVVARQITTTSGQKAPPIIVIEAARAAEADDLVTWRRTVGTFQISIPVTAKGLLLQPEERLLSVLRWIFKAIPTENRWHPVFVRYLDQVADRVDALGGNSDQIEPSPTGIGAGAARKRCALLGWLTSLLLACLVIVAAVHPVTGYLVEIVFAAATLAAAGLWWALCAPSRCRLLKAAVAGISAGAGAVAIAWLADWVGHRGALTLAVCAIALAVLLLAGLATRCLRFGSS